MSRSGRVRKKSSKLTDFQSPDEVEAARALKKALHPRPHKMSHLHTTTNEISLPSIISSRAIDQLSLSPATLNIRLDVDSDIDDDEPEPQQTLSVLNVQSINSDDDAEVMANDDLGDAVDTTVRKSAYMAEKQTRKKMRKDKGKSRYTAYIMWAKEARQQMMKTNPEMDFAAMSRRLSEMWANVPGTEKFTWRRRAKRMASKIEKASKASAKAEKKEAQAVAKSTKSKFLNRNSGSTRKRGGDKKEKSSPATTTTAATVTSRNKQTAKQATATSIAPGPYKVIGTGPTDAAAHLKLLGDSLSVIGQRLKEHEVMLEGNGILVNSND